MNRPIFRIFLPLLFLGFNLVLEGQTLSLNELQTLCTKDNWEEVNTYLRKKGWEYHDSDGDAYLGFKTIVWNLEENYSGNMARAWFRLYTYQEKPSMVRYSVVRPEDHSKIKNVINSYGYKLTGTSIEDSEISSSYANSKFYLTEATGKEEQDEWGFREQTTYAFTLIRKNTYYDDFNGPKKDYYLNGKIKAEYTLRDNVIEGEVKEYYENGGLQKISQYKNGVENGTVKIFGETGNIKIEYHKVDGLTQGPFTAYYENGKVLRKGNLLNGELHGKILEFDEMGNLATDYETENGKQHGKEIVFKSGKIRTVSLFSNDSLDGIRKVFLYKESSGDSTVYAEEPFRMGKKHGEEKVYLFLADGKKILVRKVTYKNGKESGPFFDFSRDSVVFGNYYDGKLSGEYRKYGPGEWIEPLVDSITTDTSKLPLYAWGYFLNGKEHGKWRIYYEDGEIATVTDFQSGKKHGVEKIFLPKVFQAEMGFSPQERMLVQESEYKNGELDGKLVRYFSIKRKIKPCESGSVLDTCFSLTYQPTIEIAHYSKGILNGPYQKVDSAVGILQKGTFLSGKKSGKWEYYDASEGFKGDSIMVKVKGTFENDLEQGGFEEFLLTDVKIRSLNYKNGKIDGPMLFWNINGSPTHKYHFRNGQIFKLEKFDTDINPEFIVHYKSVHDRGKADVTIFTNSGRIEQEYKTFELDIRKMDDYSLAEHLEKLDFIEKVVSKTNTSFGYPQGEYKRFTKRDELVESGEYIKDSKEGMWRYYFPLQNVRINCQFEKNTQKSEYYTTLENEAFTGEFEFIDESRKRKEVRKIKEGLRDGKTIIYDLDTGEKLEKVNYKEGELK